MANNDEQPDKATVFFMLGVMGFAMVLVDDRWVRVGLGLLPALLLAQRALSGTGVRSGAAPRVGADRRSDAEVRVYIDELLKHFREFYAMCHLVSAAQMDPEEARKRASRIERELTALLADITGAAPDD